LWYVICHHHLIGTCFSSFSHSVFITSYNVFHMHWVIYHNHFKVILNAFFIHYIFRMSFINITVWNQYFWLCIISWNFSRPYFSFLIILQWLVKDTQKEPTNTTLPTRLQQIHEL
jgi:hypothetical protein